MLATFLDNLPKVRTFKDLHLTENLRLASSILKDISGVYAIICMITGAVYIGSSMNLSNRLVDHLVSRETNEHLQNAISKHGLENFLFVLVEVFEPNPSLSLEENKINILALEQVYLDWLFQLPMDGYRYNFLRIAGSSLGYQHTEESKAKMSQAKAGLNHPMYGKTGALSHMYGKSPTDETRLLISESLKGRHLTKETRERISEAQLQVNRTGSNHPMFGKIPPNAQTVYVYTLDHVLINTFPSKTAAAQWFNVSDFTVRKYIKSGKEFLGNYILTSSPLNK